MTKEERDEIVYTLADILRSVKCPYDGITKERDYDIIVENLNKALCTLAILDLDSSWD